MPFACWSGLTPVWHHCYHSGTVQHADLFEYEYEFVEAEPAPDAPDPPRFDLRIEITEVLKSHKYALPNALVDLPDGIKRHVEAYGVDGGIETGEVGGGLFPQKALPKWAQNLLPGAGFIVRDVSPSEETLECVVNFIAHGMYPDQRLEQDRRTEQYVDRMLDHLATLNAFLRNGRKPYSLTLDASRETTAMLMEALVAGSGAITSIEYVGGGNQTFSMVLWIRPELAEEFPKAFGAGQVLDFSEA